MMLRRVNMVLSVLVALVSLYLILSPAYPAVSLWVKTALANEQDGFKYASHLSAAPAELPAPPEGNRLVIPKIFVDGLINEGLDASALDRGIWRRPASGSPAEGGNTVLAAHRYLYSAGPNTFYSLDKLEVGDEFFIIWEDREYDYRVASVREVPATAVEIEAPTTEDIVTLFTCTPVWSAKNRLVVTAELTGSFAIETDEEVQQ